MHRLKRKFFARVRRKYLFAKSSWLKANYAIKPIAEQARRPNQTVVPQRLIAALEFMESHVRMMMKVALSVWMLVAAFAAQADDPNAFVNEAAGLRLTKPADWVYVTAAQNLENLKAIKLTDAEFHATMQKYATAPLVAIMKHEEPYEDVNPSFKVNLKPYGSLKGKTPVELVEFVIPQIGKVFKDFAIDQAAMEVEVAGVTSAYARVNYTMEIPDGRTFPTTSELWIIPHGEYFFMIGAGTRQDEKTGTREEVQEILKSIKIGS